MINSCHCKALSSRVIDYLSPSFGLLTLIPYPGHSLTAALLGAVVFSNGVRQFSWEQFGSIQFLMKQADQYDNLRDINSLSPISWHCLLWFVTESAFVTFYESLVIFIGLSGFGGFYLYFSSIFLFLWWLRCVLTKLILDDSCFHEIAFSQTVSGKTIHHVVVFLFLCLTSNWSIKVKKHIL